MSMIASAGDWSALPKIQFFTSSKKVQGPLPPPTTSSCSNFPITSPQHMSLKLLADPFHPPILGSRWLF